MVRYVIGLKEFTALRNRLKLTATQEAVLIGSILGDGCLQVSKRGDSARLQVRNNQKYSEYVGWKYQFLRSWSPRGLLIDRCNNSIYFTTIYHPEILNWYRKFYRISKKIVPQDISDILKDPLSVAIWLMDDGNGYLRTKALRISSYCFNGKENRLLQECLKNNFGIETKLYLDSKGYQLYIPSHSAVIVYELIRTYIHPEMNYKFTRLNPVETTRLPLPMGEAG